MAKGHEEAEEEEAEGKGTRKPITPAVTVADDDLCTITVTEKFEDEWGTIGLTVEITNKSDKDLTFYSPSGKTNVDGTMKEPWFSCHLMPGTNATEEFTFSTSDLDSIDDLVNITIGIDAYETETYGGRRFLQRSHPVMRAAGNNEQRPLEQQAGPRGNTPRGPPLLCIRSQTLANAPCWERCFPPSPHGPPDA